MTAANKSRPPIAYPRFTLSQRVEHVVMLTAFTGLALTGLPQKFALEPWAQAMIAAVGGVETVRVIHRVLATILMAQVVYHGGAITYRLAVLRQAPSMLPGVRDVIDLIQRVAYNLRLRKEPPKLSRYNYEEKLEYWALVWGMVVMILTGFMLWNPIATTRFMDGQFIPAAKAAHGSEALLAVIAIVTWHMYNVHLKHFNKSMWTGKLDRHAMEADHALELQQLESGQYRPAPTRDEIRRRLRVFVPVAVIVSGVLLGGIFLFVTFEQTAITTIPPYEIEVVPPELQGP